MPQRTKKNKQSDQPESEAETTESEFLDAAEIEFAEHGFAGAKIRKIADAANANLGTLHYYWGTKAALFRAVCERRFRPLVEKRIEMLDRCLVEAADGKPTIEALIDAYFVPVFLKYRDEIPKCDVFIKLVIRVRTDPSIEVRTIMGEILDEVDFRFTRLLRNACPHVDDQTFYWRLHGVFGLFQHATSYRERVARLSHGKFDGEDLETGFARLLDFLVSGLRAPQPVTTVRAPAKP